MPQERLSKQALLAKVKGQWDDHEYAGQTTLRILDGIAWGFNQVKCWKWWRTMIWRLNLELLPLQPSRT